MNRVEFKRALKRIDDLNAIEIKIVFKTTEFGTEEVVLPSYKIDRMNTHILIDPRGMNILVNYKKIISITDATKILPLECKIHSL